MTGTEAIGLTAAGLAGYAYVPQISHLVREHCSAGLSERAFALWLGSSVLMTIHAISIGSGVFVVLGLQQIGCTGAVALFCRRYRGQTCPSHDTPPPTSASPPIPLHGGGVLRIDRPGFGATQGGALGGSQPKAQQAVIGDSEAA